MLVLILGFGTLEDDDVEDDDDDKDTALGEMSPSLNEKKDDADREKKAELKNEEDSSPLPSPPLVPPPPQPPPPLPPPRPGCCFFFPNPENTFHFELGLPSLLLLLLLLLLFLLLSSDLTKL
jgi:hypothetical protein